MEIKDVIKIIVHRYLGTVLETPSFIKQEGATSQFYQEQRRDSAQGSKHVCCLFLEGAKLSTQHLEHDFWLGADKIASYIFI